MQDLTIELENQPGALAAMGEALGAAGVSVEGGGAWVVAGRGVAHFLVADGTVAGPALAKRGIRVTAIRDVHLLRLKQDEAGQLGKICRRMADAGVNIETLYSDHDHQLVLVAEPAAAAAQVAAEWMRERTSARAETKTHHYAAHISWTGNTGAGTRDYRSYRRDHEITGTDKTPIAASSDPAFRGDATRYNPEELLVASLASCHMLWYLHLCAVNGVVVTAYEDHPAGTMDENPGGSGQFSGVTLHPAVTIAAGSDLNRATQLHAEAHQHCFIARSVNFRVTCEPVITVAN